MLSFDDEELSLIQAALEDATDIAAEAPLQRWLDARLKAIVARIEQYRADKEAGDA